MSRVTALLVLLALLLSAPVAASRITSALPDLTVTPGLLTIEGLDFGLQEGEVFLVVDATAVPLPVIPPWGDSLIVVEFPDPPPAPGTYLLAVDPPEMPFAFFEVSIGAVGPPGPPGPPGETGVLDCQIESAFRTQNPATLQCSAGRIRTGGGCGEAQNQDIVEDSYPVDPNGWECTFGGGGGVTISVVCCSLELAGALP